MASPDQDPSAPEATSASTDEPLAHLGEDDSDAAALRELEHPHRRKLVMLGGLLVLIVVSIIIGQWNDAWRAIVLDVRGDQMFLGYAKKPPEWVGGRLTDPGNIVAKEPWKWDPEPTTVNVEDDALVALYQRYTKTYTGTLVEIRPPTRPGTFPLGVIRTDAGGREYVSLVDTVLLGATLNRRVVKQAGAWDPKLLPPDSAGAQLALPPANDNVNKSSPAPAAPTEP